MNHFYCENCQLFVFLGTVQLSSRVSGLSVFVILLENIRILFLFFQFKLPYHFKIIFQTVLILINGSELDIIPYKLH